MTLSIGISISIDRAFGGGAQVINAPTLTLATASGASPANWNIAGDSTFQPGMFVHQQFATNSAFTTGITDYFTQIQGSQWEASSATIGNGLVTFVQPTGTYFQRARFETSPNDAPNNILSPWSNTQTDTIVGSTAVLTHAAGAGLSIYQTVNSPFYQGILNTANIGAMCAVRATISAQNTKFHTEFTANSFAAVGGNSIFYCGFDDATPAFNSPGYILDASVPGTSGKPGITIKAQKGGTSAQIAINGTAFATLTLPSAMASGNVFAFDIDTTPASPTLLITYFDTSAHVLNSGAAFTLSTGIPATFNAFLGGGSGNGTATDGNSDSATLNPSSSVTAWKVPPQTGFGQYG